MRNPGRDPGRDVRDDDGAQPAPRRDEEHRDREGPLPEESARRPYRREGRDRDERRSRNDRLRYLLSGLEAAPSPSRSSVEDASAPGRSVVAAAQSDRLAIAWSRWPRHLP